eukprot:GHVR01025467.1.p1 GENE.GHVR01025467.1~~GHVR01025467.1.p1  ORF type:complete len:105 (-),score=10.64 GHVR01025467.1:214-528(-)
MEVPINKLLISGQATTECAGLKGKFIANMDMLNQEANEMIRDITWLIVMGLNDKWPWHGAKIQLHPQMRGGMDDCLRSLSENARPWGKRSNPTPPRNLLFCGCL